MGIMDTLCGNRLKTVSRLQMMSLSRENVFRGVVMILGGLLDKFGGEHTVSIASQALSTVICPHRKQNIVNAPLSDDLPVRGNGYDVQRNALTAVFGCCFHCSAQAAATGYGHPGDGDGADIVVLKNLRQLFRCQKSTKKPLSDQIF